MANRTARMKKKQKLLFHLTKVHESGKISKLILKKEFQIAFQTI